MNKVIEALERIETTFSMNKKGKESAYRQYTNSIYPYYEDFDLVLNALEHLEAIDKENEILKEIIKSLFDNGCPLHQYIDKDFGLTIEVDNDCSIMHLGEYKGINLDEKLKEVIK